MRQKTLLGTGLLAVFSIVTYILYVNKLLGVLAGNDELSAVTVMALVYFVPNLVELIEEVQNNHETNRVLFWLDIVLVLLALVYLGILWFLVSSNQQIWSESPEIVKNSIISLPAVFLIRKIVAFFGVIVQLSNRIAAGKQ